MGRVALVVLGAVLLARPVAAADPDRRFVHPGPDGRLGYAVGARGARAPDFSPAGYGGGAVIPDAPVRDVVAPAAGDSGPRIQAALDYVATLPPGADGLRGAVLLLAGRHEVAGQLRLGASGVVLRGQGEGTVLVAAGTDRRALIQVRGRADRALEGKASAVADGYVPVGADTVRLAWAGGLKAGDTVLVERPGTKEWVAALGMDRFPSRDQGSYLDWRPESMGLTWDRVIKKVDGDAVTLDAPL